MQPPSTKNWRGENRGMIWNLWGSAGHRLVQFGCLFWNAVPLALLVVVVDWIIGYALGTFSSDDIHAAVINLAGESLYSMLKRSAACSPMPTNYTVAPCFLSRG